METPTNRELNKDIKHIKETTIRIEQQVMKTNGRVSSLEKWRAYTVGAFAVVTALFIPIIIYFITNHII